MLEQSRSDFVTARMSYCSPLSRESNNIASFGSLFSPTSLIPGRCPSTSSILGNHNLFWCGWLASLNFLVFWIQESQKICFKIQTKVTLNKPKKGKNIFVRFCLMEKEILNKKKWLVTTFLG